MSNRLLTPSSSASLLASLVERRGSRASALSEEDEERQHLLEADHLTEQSTSGGPQTVLAVEQQSRLASSASNSSFVGANTYGSFDENMAAGGGTANGRGELVL
jgi:hypothetical protein